MEVIIWSDKYSVNVKEIDEQHKRLVNIIDDLLSSINASKEKEFTSSIVDRLQEYAEFHFSTEEKYMLKFNYTGYNSHKKEHDKFIDKVTEFRNRIKLEESAITTDITTFIWNWLKTHVKGIDKQYSACFNKNGLQ